MIKWVPPLLTAIASLLGLLGARKDKKPVVIVVDGKRLAVPSSDETTNKFVRGLDKPHVEESAKEPSVKKSSKKAKKSTGRRR